MPATSSPPTHGPAATGWPILAERGLPAFVLLMLARGHDRAGRMGQSSQRSASGRRARGPHHRRHPDRARGGRRLRRRAAPPGAHFLRLDGDRRLASTAAPDPRAAAARTRAAVSVAAVAAIGGVLVLHALAQVFAMAIAVGRRPSRAGAGGSARPRELPHPYARSPRNGVAPADATGRVLTPSRRAISFPAIRRRALVLRACRKAR